MDCTCGFSHRCFSHLAPSAVFLGMRYFAELAYRGTRYAGWQKQPHSPSVQQTIEEVLFTLLREEVEVVGCGRTDTGVHASFYVLHFDYAGAFPEHFLNRLNRLLPRDIAFYRLFPVRQEAHARYDAERRVYEYHLCWRKNPFAEDTAWWYPPAEHFSEIRLQQAASLLRDFDAFYPFCKSNTDVKTMRCELFRSEWERREEEGKWVYHVSADRFLRGMVRLIVGMCVNVARGKLALEEVRRALQRQERLKRSESVAPQGLFLTEVRYPDQLRADHQRDQKEGRRSS